MDIYAVNAIQKKIAEFYPGKHERVNLSE